VAKLAEVKSGCICTGQARNGMQAMPLYCWPDTNALLFMAKEIFLAAACMKALSLVIDAFIGSESGCLCWEQALNLVCALLHHCFEQGITMPAQCRLASPWESHCARMSSTFGRMSKKALTIAGSRWLPEFSLTVASTRSNGQASR
jgi:hypothetical protein